MTKLTPQEDFALTTKINVLMDIEGAKNDVLTYYESLGADAKPSVIDFDADWGSERQLKAEARFFDAVEELGIDLDDLTYNNLKASTDEMIKMTLKVVEERLSELGS